MATSVDELYLCPTHGWLRSYRYVLLENYEALQLCPYCGEPVEVIDIEEARALLRKYQKEEENGR